MTSERLKSSSTLTFSTPISLAFSSLRNGSNAMTFIPSPCARFATSPPMAPIPTTPRTLLKSSTPVNFFFSHRPCFIEFVACGMRLASESMSDIVCSAVVMVFPPGVFMTTMPFFEAAALSTLSRPLPARPMTFRFVAASITSAVSLVALLMTMPLYLPITLLSSSGDIPVFTSTLRPASFSILTPFSERLSLTSTFIYFLMRSSWARATPVPSFMSCPIDLSTISSPAMAVIMSKTSE